MVFKRATVILTLGAAIVGSGTGIVGCGAGSTAGDPMTPGQLVGRAAHQPGNGSSGKHQLRGNATVFATDGTAVDLASLWQTSNVALVFYRGHW